MKNYEGGGEKFLPVTCMGSGTAPFTHGGTTFLTFLEQPSLLLSPQFTITKRDNFLLTTGDQKTGDEKL